ncbi:E3 SUMO-protein ligase ZBED1-like [Pholidichthys leucotaenia]
MQTVEREKNTQTGASTVKMETEQPAMKINEQPVCGSDCIPQQQLCNKENNSSLEQQKPESLQIKEEQEVEQLIQKQETDIVMVTAISGENERREPESKSEQVPRLISVVTENQDDEESQNGDSRSPESEEMKPSKKRMKTRSQSHREDAPITQVKEEEEELCVGQDEENFSLKQEEDTFFFEDCDNVELGPILVQRFSNNSPDTERQEQEAEPARKRGRSQMWGHFQMAAPNKVKCLLCHQLLSYNNNTSSMLRHFKAKHEGSHEYPDHAVRKLELDEALVNMLVKDVQPFSIVDDQGFRAFVRKLDHIYTLPSKQALKKMVDDRYEEEKTKAKAQLRSVDAVSLTCDMWTSINMDSYLAVTCHYVLDSAKLATVLLGVLPFPQDHTAEDIAAAKRSLMVKWSIEGKVKCLVTDAAANMIGAARNLAIRHVVCIAHALNLVVKKSLDQTPGLEDLRTRAWKVVTYFRSSTTAKEKLRNVQQQINRAATKLIQEEDTRWNSTFLMMQCLYEERQAVGLALAVLGTEVTPLTSEEYETIAACLQVLNPFHMATMEMSQQKRVSGSMVIPLIKMLLHTTQEIVGNTTNMTAKLLGQNISATLRNKFDNLENSTILSLSTLLDPRFKTIGFRSQDKAQNAVQRLTAECAVLMRYTPDTSTDHPSTSAAPQPAAPTGQTPSSTGFNLWKSLDEQTTMARTHRNSTADATVEVQRYMTDPPLDRCEDPLTYWKEHKNIYPHLFSLAKQYLCTPASSVPCERVFSKAGEVVGKKRNRLSPKTAEKILFLNKNL